MGDFFIESPRTVIPALDCPPARAAQIVQGVSSNPLVQSFKLGAWKGTLRSGLDAYIQAIGPFLNGRKLIYDHQKGATDIPDLEDALPSLVDAGVHAVILFPFGGKITQERWTASAIGAGLTVIVGGHMTQPGFLYSEGGYIADESPGLIYERAVQQRVRCFVVPGNRPELVLGYRVTITTAFQELGLSSEVVELFAPGFVKQGGVISETGKVAGERWHAVVGSAFVDALDVETVVRELTSQLV